MSAGSSYLDARPSGRRSIGLAVAIVAHIILIYALVTGLGRKVIEVIKQPLETKIIEEVKPPPPPPPEAPPPPPKLAAPPPPFIPPPEIKIAAPPPEPTITAVTREAPPAPSAPVIAKPVEAAPAAKPAPPPPPPAPKPRFRANIKPIYRPPVEELVYPRQAAREGITGHVNVHITVSPSGDVKDAYVKDSQPKRIFDKAALEYVMRFKFEKGDEEFEAEQDVVFNLQ